MDAQTHLDYLAPHHPRCPPATLTWRDSCVASESAHVGGAAQNEAAPVWPRYETCARTGRPSANDDLVRTAAPSSPWPTRRRRPTRLPSPAGLCTHMTADLVSVWATTIDRAMASLVRTTPSRRNGRCRTVGLHQTIASWMLVMGDSTLDECCRTSNGECDRCALFRPAANEYRGTAGRETPVRLGSWLSLWR